MKKIISLLLCLMMVALFSACGKEDSGAALQSTEGAANVQEDKAEDSTAADEAEGTGETEAAPSQESEGEAGEEPVVINSAEELESMVNEFNETDDPERKEELRQELEKILEQAEQAAADVN